MILNPMKLLKKTGEKNQNSNKNISGGFLHLCQLKKKEANS